MPQSEKNQDSGMTSSQLVLTAFSAIGTFLIFVWVLRHSSYGIDFTDEAFHLVSISNPFIYDLSVTQYGFVYHPIYLLLDGDIAAIRQVNILITFGLAWGLTYTFLISVAPRISKQPLILQIISASLATSSFVIFSSWIPTPSYNSLTLQALMITAIGLLLAGKLVTFASIFGWITIGIGGSLVFLAKPSSALALAICALSYLLFSQKLSTRLLLLALASAFSLLLFSVMLIDGSILAFVKRLKLGIEFVGYLEGGHTFNEIFRINSFRLSFRNVLAIILIFIASFVATWGVLSDSKRGMLASLSISFAFFTLIILLTFGEVHKVANLGRFENLLIISVGLTAVLSSLVFGKIAILRSTSSVRWNVTFLFLAMPHIYAFGTNSNYWMAGSSALIFWLLAGLTLLVPIVNERTTWSFVIPLTLAIQAVTATLLQTGLEKPYRQPQPLRLNSAALEIGPQKSSLILSDGYARYITTAVGAATNAGFNPGIPVIDLSGQSPGILYALGAESIGMAWVIGGYPGSLNLAKAALRRTPCEKIAAAWVLYEPDGPRSIPIEVMSSLGSKFPGNYKKIGTWQTANGAGGYNFKRTQKLYAPIASDKTLQVCQNMREKNKG